MGELIPKNNFRVKEVMVPVETLHQRVQIKISSGSRVPFLSK